MKKTVVFILALILAAQTAVYARTFQYTFRAVVHDIQPIEVKDEYKAGARYSWKEFLAREEPPTLVCGADAGWKVKLKITEVSGGSNPLKPGEVLYALIHSPVQTFVDADQLGKTFKLGLIVTFIDEDEVVFDVQSLL